MKAKIIIFDFDGTIADTRKTIVAAKQETMRRLGLPVLSEEACASTIGLSATLAFRQNFPELSEEMLDRCVEVFRPLFEETKKTVPPVLFENAEEVLRELKARGIVLTIATSRNSVSLRRFTEEWNLNEYFTYILGGSDTERLKPHPDPVLKTLKDLSFRPEEALVVGDMPYDIEMGKRAGVRTCGVTYGNSDRETLLASGADVVIDDIRELCGIIA